MSAALIETSVPRMLADTLFERQSYWTSGKAGKLSLPRDKATGRWIHPFWNVDEDDPAIEIAPVSGKGTIFTFTVNLQTYNPAVAPPYVVAIVQLDEQDDLRIVTNIVGCDPANVAIGMRVEVAFEPHGALFVPVFMPAD